MTPLTHRQVDKIIRQMERGRQVVMPRSAERWVIRACDRHGHEGYWGYTRDGYPGVSKYQSNAWKYASEDEARQAAYVMRDIDHKIRSFDVEKLPPI